jgi:hypothetical protein
LDKVLIQDSWNQLIICFLYGVLAMSAKSYGIGLFIILLSLAGCGGGSGGGDNGGGTPSSSNPPNTSPATVTTSNSEGVSRSTIDVASKAPGYEVSAGALKTRGTNGDLEAINSRVADLVRDGMNLRSDPNIAFRVIDAVPCASSGSITLDFPDLNQGQAVPSSGSAIITFDNCNEFGEILDGTADFTWSGGFDNNQGFRNFTVVINVNVTLQGQPSQSVSGTVTCTDYGNSCSVQESFQGSDGASVTVEDVTVSGNSTSGYNLSAQVYHEEYGALTINAMNLTFCENGNIQSGTISVTDSTNTVVLVITFTNCDDFTATFNGVSNTYPQ